MRLIRLLTATLMLLIIMAGCGAANRPEQQPDQGTAPPPTTGAAMQVNPNQQRFPSPRAGSAYDDPSMGVSTIASAVPGAGEVDAVVLGNVALAGLPTGDTRIHHKVALQIQASFPHIVEVRFTTDPNTIGRLREIRRQIMTQQSISPYLPELANLSAAMQPAP